MKATENARERDLTPSAPGSEDAGNALLKEGKRAFREILKGSGLQANDPWLREVQLWIERPTTQCWRDIPAMTSYRINPASKALIECTFARIRSSLDSFKIGWKEHAKAREKTRHKAREKDRPKDRASKHDPDKDKSREKGRPKERASKRPKGDDRTAAQVNAKKASNARYRDKHRHLSLFEAANVELGCLT